MQGDGVCSRNKPYEPISKFPSTALTEDPRALLTEASEREPQASDTCELFNQNSPVAFSARAGPALPAVSPL